VIDLHNLWYLASRLRARQASAIRPVVTHHPRRSRCHSAPALSVDARYLPGVAVPRSNDARDAHSGLRSPTPVCFTCAFGKIDSPSSFESRVNSRQSLTIQSNPPSKPSSEGSKSCSTRRRLLACSVKLLSRQGFLSSMRGPGIAPCPLTHGIPRASRK
jgi:hypothetical protein